MALERHLIKYIGEPPILGGRPFELCTNPDFAITPITNCGKGDPMQSLAMGNGGPSVRARATAGSVRAGTGAAGGQ